MTKRKITFLWSGLMVVLIVIYAVLFVELGDSIRDRQLIHAQLVEQRDQLNAQIQELNAQLDYVRSARGVEQLARANGMIMPGETQFIAIESE